MCFYDSNSHLSCRPATFLAIAAGVLFSHCSNKAPTPTIVALDTVITDSVPFKKMFQPAMFDSTKMIQLKGIDSLAGYKLYLDEPGMDVLLGAPNLVKDYILYVS